MPVRSMLLITAVVLCGLIAGLFFGWLVSVIPGLRVVTDRSYINTMQSINVAIVNPGFLIAFLATPVLLVVAGVAEYRAGNRRRSLLLACAAVTYALGGLGVTFGGNIPLNNSLDAFELDGASIEQAKLMRTSYEEPWNRWHLARTLASGLAFVLATTATLVTEAE